MTTFEQDQRSGVWFCRVFKVFCVSCGLVRGLGETCRFKGESVTEDPVRLVPDSAESHAE